MKINKKGFSAVEVFIVFVVITSMGFVGWRVYDSSQNPDNTSEVVTRTTDNNQQKSTVETQSTNQGQVSEDPAGWTEYKNNVDNYRLAYPKDWYINDIQSTSVTISPSSDGSVPNIDVWIAELNNSSCDQTKSQLSEVVVDGISAQQFTDSFQVPKITTCFTKDNKVYHIVHAYIHSSLQDEYDQLLETFRFLK